MQIRETFENIKEKTLYGINYIRGRIHIPPKYRKIVIVVIALVLFAMLFNMQSDNKMTTASKGKKIITSTSKGANNLNPNDNPSGEGGENNTNGNGTSGNNSGSNTNGNGTSNNNNGSNTNGNGTSNNNNGSNTNGNGTSDNNNGSNTNDNGTSGNNNGSNTNDNGTSGDNEGNSSFTFDETASTEIDYSNFDIWENTDNSSSNYIEKIINNIIQDETSNISNTKPRLAVVMSSPTPDWQEKLKMYILSKLEQERREGNIDLRTEITLVKLDFESNFGFTPKGDRSFTVYGAINQIRNSGANIVLNLDYFYSSTISTALSNQGIKVISPILKESDFFDDDHKPKSNVTGVSINPSNYEERAVNALNLMADTNNKGPNIFAASVGGNYFQDFIDSGLNKDLFYSELEKVNVNSKNRFYFQGIDVYMLANYEDAINNNIIRYPDWLFINTPFIDYDYAGNPGGFKQIYSSLTRNKISFSTNPTLGMQWGALCSIYVEQYDVALKAFEMALDVVKGEDISNIKMGFASNTKMVLNKTVANKLFFEGDSFYKKRIDFDIDDFINYLESNKISYDQHISFKFDEILFDEILIVDYINFANYYNWIQ